MAIIAELLMAFGMSVNTKYERTTCSKSVKARRHKYYEPTRIMMKKVKENQIFYTTVNLKVRATTICR